MYAPVVLFVYNRLDHTVNVIQSLSGNLLAGETDLYVFSDAAKSDAGKEKVNQVREYIHQTDWHNNFKSVTIVQAECNKGLARSIIEGVSSLIEKYGRVIVVEDDLILSPSFLQFMNGALEFYQNVPEIWSISGYSFPMKSLKEYDHDVFYSYRGSSWGWATWSDRWEKVDWEVKQFPELMEDKEWMKRFNRGGNDLVNMLKLQVEGKIDSWAIRWCFTESNLNMYTVYPKVSYVQNDGCDGSGTHSGKNEAYNTKIQGEVKVCRFEKLKIEKRIAKEFYNKYSDTFGKKVKRNLKKIRNAFYKTRRNDYERKVSG